MTKELIHSTQNNQIERVLEVQGRSVTWLARRLNMTRMQLYWRMKVGFSATERERIEQALDVPQELLFSVPSTVTVEQHQTPEDK